MPEWWALFLENGERSRAMAQGPWYYCLIHLRVEEGPGCRNDMRLGPYETRDAAEHALQRAAERSAAWENDPRWKDDR
ncbi:hypothetical protein TH66_15080 [Carbonactinospora thermoautotrophica]|uniref:SPOR domain-containing protein n=2 Tax=Carbonactinospora thermoautotrophica TaxID=1469144 RepID=A0A132NE30_9ACTN|nr:hypothetical protein TH66_15080 [Carbonactinospora thermoautotrophica]KWX08373.1 hypothetical protein TR74_15300 [Carbonactinospora thermoautotrophica]